jgi:hypothetical protein
LRIYRPEKRQDVWRYDRYHRRDGTPVDPMGLAPTTDDTLQRALEWIIQVMMTVGPG